VAAIFFFVILIGGVLFGGLFLVLASGHAFILAAAHHVEQAKLNDGEAILLATLRPQVQAAPAANSWTLPTDVQPTPACSGTGIGCGLTYTVHYEYAGGTGSGSAAGGATVSAVNLQQNPGVLEGRVVVRMIITVFTPGAQQLAQDEHDITYRTTADAPYVVPVGVIHVSSSQVRGGGSGDTGGCDPANPTTCAAGATAVSDTRIHAVDLCTPDPRGVLCDTSQQNDDQFQASTNYNNNSVQSGAWIR
jgi:hypothetical protein